MKYYIHISELEDEDNDAILAAYSDYLDRIRVKLDSGIELPMEDILIPIKVFAEEASLRGKMTDHLILDDLECGVITQKGIDLLNSLNISNIQYLPIILNDPYSNAEAVLEAELKDEKLEFKEKIYEQYSLFNVVGLADCIDHNKSDLDYYSTPIEIPDDLPEEMKEAFQQEEDLDVDFIRKLVLDEEKIPDDISVFRLKDCPRILVFKEDVVKAIREAGLSGFVFVPLEEYTDEIPDDDDDDVRGKYACSCRGYSRRKTGSYSRRGNFRKAAPLHRN